MENKELIKEFEGFIKIKWHKNSYENRFPLYIECKDKKELKANLKKIEQELLDNLENEDYKKEYEKLGRGNSKYPYEMYFHMEERGNGDDELNYKRIYKDVFFED